MSQQTITDALFSPQSSPRDINGALVYVGWLDPEAQAQMVADVRALIDAAQLVRPMTPWGKPMSVQMTSAGRYGWVTDRTGYRYQEHHPETGSVWPAIPECVLNVWRAVADTPILPDSCLINHYDQGARLGLHQDKNEADYSYPVVSISLGAPATFRIGGTKRSDPTRSTTLTSGDVLVMGGAARLAYHGVDRIKIGDSALVPDGGRLNLTLRRVDPA